MTQVLFNQFAYTDRLTRGGFTPEQARAAAEALETAFAESVATKTDLARVEAGLKADIDRVEVALKGDIDRVESGLKADIDRLDAKIDRVETGLKADIDRLGAGVKAEFATVRTEMARFETRIVSEIHTTIYKGGGILGTVLGVIAIIDKLWK